MSDLSARLDLPLIKPSQAQKHVTHNEALQLLDGLVQAALEETDAETPPFEPVTGELYALGANPNGDWAGQAGKLALRVETAWLFLSPQAGWRAWDKAAGQFKVFDSVNGWVQIVPELENLPGVGINTTSDTTNRLSVASAASLFSHEGAGHQLKVNKAASADTASLLFQSNWTGHAEMGLAGDTAFSIKVSDDGATWYDAIKADAAAQEITLSMPVTGAAVQSSKTDDTAGVLMTTGAFGVGGLMPTVADLGVTDNSIAPGFYSYNPAAGSVGGPTGVNRGAVWHARRAPGGGETQLMIVETAVGGSGLRQGDVFTRSRVVSAWSEWARSVTNENLVGTVSETAGVPTGAVIERGSNANGEYVRWADGTQIATNGNAAITTAPAAFVGTITKIDADKLWIGTWY